MAKLEVLLEPSVNYTYSFVLGVEDGFNQPVTSEWMQRNWHKSFYVIAAYLILVFGGKNWMSGRPKMQLRKPLVLWNVVMAVFSILGTFRTIPELLFVLKNFGFRYSICNPSFILLDKVSGFWCFAFTLSKILELLDTAFIVLRKQNLIFLHWYHHASVLVLTWYFYAAVTPLGRWFMCMNFFVHSLMYTYYALRALGCRLPRPVAMMVTIIQIAQTIFGSYVILYSAVAWLTNQECQVQGDVVGLALALYLSNFILFVQFFANSYFKRGSKSLKTQ